MDDVPRTLSEAYASPDAEYWKEAVRSEMDSIITKGTWEITDLPVDCKPVGCKWILKKKLAYLEKAALKMKKWADTGRRPRDYRKGDLVLVKPQPGNLDVLPQGEQGAGSQV